MDLWLSKVSRNLQDNCVILYKRQGEETNMDSIMKTDFLLGIITQPQVEMLQKFGNGGIVCMDTIHGTKPCDFYLISVVIADDYGEGFPVAFLISNKESYVALKYFILAIKKKAGAIKASVFMSDDAEQYFSAWNSVMESAKTKKMLCIWHVDRAWRYKISMIKNKTKQENVSIFGCEFILFIAYNFMLQVYKTLCVLRQECNIINFQKYLSSFLELLASDAELKEFGDYFKSTYVNRCTEWVACYRVASGRNTNIYLESMHKELKYIYLKGKYYIIIKLYVNEF